MDINGATRPNYDTLRLSIAGEQERNLDRFAHQAEIHRVRGRDEKDTKGALIDRGTTRLRRNSGTASADDETVNVIARV